MRNAASSVEDEEERDVCFFGLDLVDLDLDFCLAIISFVWSLELARVQCLNLYGANDNTYELT